MSKPRPGCAVCTSHDALSGIVVGGKTLYVCHPHRQAIGVEKFDSFDDLASFFALPEVDRRSRPDRRNRDRRQFPPRPERRRHNMGRRTDDPK